MPASSKSKMLQDLVEDILEETLGEEDKKNKEAVKKAVRNIINEIYGDKEFTIQEIDASVENYFNKIQSKKQKEVKKTSGDALDEEVYDMLREIESQMKKTDTPDHAVDKELQIELNELQDDSLLNFTEFQDDHDLDLSEFQEDEQDIDIDLDLSEFHDDEDYLNLDLPVIQEKQQKRDEHLTDIAAEEKEESEASDLDEKDDEGISFYDYITSINDKVLKLWEDDHPQMQEEFEKVKIDLNLALEKIKIDTEKHNNLNPKTKGELQEINQSFLKTFKLFEKSIEELISFLDTEDPTYIFSSKKKANEGNTIIQKIGETLNNTG